MIKLFRQPLSRKLSPISWTSNVSTTSDNLVDTNSMPTYIEIPWCASRRSHRGFSFSERL